MKEICSRPSTGYKNYASKNGECPVLLAASFSRSNDAVKGTARVEEQALRVQLELDSLSLSKEQIVDFFKIESRVRAASSAESLGLAPVVAHQIITAFGGTMRLVKGEGHHGYLEATFLEE